MGVYLLFGVKEVNVQNATQYDIHSFRNFQHIKEEIQYNNTLACIFICEASHKVKKKAEQLVAKNALEILKYY